MFETLLSQGAVKRPGPGRPKLRPQRIAGDKGYSSRKIRSFAQRHGIRITIPHRRNEHHPGQFDRTIYKQRNRVERLIQPDETVPAPGHPLRETGRELPNHVAHRCHYPVAMICKHTLVYLPDEPGSPSDGACSGFLKIVNAIVYLPGRTATPTGQCIRGPGQCFCAARGAAEQAGASSWLSLSPRHAPGGRHWAITSRPRSPAESAIHGSQRPGRHQALEERGENGKPPPASTRILRRLDCCAIQAG